MVFKNKILKNKRIFIILYNMEFRGGIVFGLVISVRVCVLGFCRGFWAIGCRRFWVFVGFGLGVGFFVRRVCFFRRRFGLFFTADVGV